MDKKYLLKTANELKKISINASGEYEQKADELISKMNDLMLKRTDIIELVGEKNIDMMKDNHSNHVRFITSILKNHNPDVLVDTVLWVFRAYRSRGFKSNYWSAQLNGWIEVMKNVISEECFKEVLPYYKWMSNNIPAFVKLSDEKLDAEHSMH